MRKLLITISDDIDKELAKFPNQSEILREAFRIYNGNISTDTLARLRAAFQKMAEDLEQTNQKLDKVLQKMEMY